jgi:hypothetical protein
MDVYLITIELPLAEPAMPLADPSIDDPGDVPARCEWLFDPDSSLQVAIAYDLTGEFLQCDQLATHSGVVPAPTAEEPDYLVALCHVHWEAAKPEGLRDAVSL